MLDSLARHLGRCIAAMAVVLLCVCSDGTRPPLMTLAELCRPDVIQRALPPGVTVADISNLHTALPEALRTTRNGVVLVRGNQLGDGAPPYCVVTGRFITNPSTGKTANFGAVLPEPAAWNGRYLQFGCGGNCGVVFDAGTPMPALVRAGYAMWHTDDGHVDRAATIHGNALTADSSWAAASPGIPDRDAMDDYLHRAVHALAGLGARSTAMLYGAPRIKRSYFMGCSDGGREAMVEATRYPDDFDGIVAGAPYELVRSNLSFMRRQLAQLRSAGAAISRTHVELLARLTAARCDAADGVRDGLVQAPDSCGVDILGQVPMCSDRQAENCLTTEQFETIAAFLNPVVDGEDNVISAGWTLNALTSHESAFYRSPPDPAPGPDPFGAEPYLETFSEWSFANYNLRNQVFAGASDYNGRTSLGIRFLAGDGSDRTSFRAVVPAATVEQVTSAFEGGLWEDPRAASAFIRKGGKLILYHGWDDAVLNAHDTVRYYQSLAAAHGGYNSLRTNVRLFMAPGVTHCIGGPGPNAFVNHYNVPQLFAGPAVPFDPDHDMLAALDAWVDRGVAPRSIVATKYTDDQASKPVLRTMPLCPFPARARHRGGLPMNDAGSWYCPADDKMERAAELPVPATRGRGPDPQ